MHRRLAGKTWPWIWDKCQSIGGCADYDDGALEYEKQTCIEGIAVGVIWVEWIN